MKKNRVLTLLFTIIMVFSILLSACGAPAPAEEAPVAEAPAEEAPAEEAPAEEPAVIDPADADLDGGYGKLIDTMEGYNALKDIPAIAAMLAEDNPPFLLDVRNLDELEEKGHIEGAVHIPLRDLAKNLDLLPSFDTPIIAYCGSGWRAAIAMPALTALGWNDVKTFHPPSYGGWVEQGFPIVEGAAPEAEVLNAADPDPAMVAAMDEMLSAIPEGWGVIKAEDLATEIVDNPDLILIDVRKPGEVETSMIDAPNVLWVTLDDFINLQDQWPADLDAPIVTYCKAGHRSTVAMTILWSYGYTNVRSLKGGFVGWKGAGYPIAGGLEGNYSKMLTNMVGYNAIKDPADLLLEMAEDTPPFVLDVRTTAEVEETGHIEGAYHIPLSELAQNTDKLPAFDTPIVTYCKGGWRGTIAMTALHGMGWTDVRVLKTPYGDWKEGGNPTVDGLPEAMVFDAVTVAESITAPVDAALLWAKDNGWGIKTADDLSTELLEKPELILIDVRRTEELEEKGIIGADQEQVHIPLESFITKSKMWPADKEAEIVIYCGSGHRSTMAMEVMLSMGYSNVKSLKGGFGGWAEAGLPVADFVAAE